MRENNRPSDSVFLFALHISALTFIVILIAWVIIHLFFGGVGNDRGQAAIEAAVLTLGAEQREIQRSGEYLGSKEMLEAHEPELGRHFIDGGLDRAEVTEDDRALTVEYSSGGGTIRMNFLDGNLVNVTCQGITACPSAAEIYDRSEEPSFS